MSEKFELQSLYELMARSICEYPDDLTVYATGSVSSATIVAQANVNDHGKLLGSHRRTLDAVQGIMRLAARKRRMAIHIILEEPKPGKFIKGASFRPRHDWESKDSQKLADTLKTMLEAVCRNPVKVSFYEPSKTGTILTAQCSPEDWNETLSPDSSVIAHFEIILHAIGKTKGRTVFIDIVKENP